MLAGLSALELGRLRMSVGYGSHRKGRPLSPVEVGSLVRKALCDGASLGDCARAMQLDGTGHIGRFVRILELPEDVRHMVDWGAGREFVGFSAAVELAKLNGAEDQRAVARAILAEGLSSREVRDVAQLRRRSDRAVEACIAEVVGMRPRVERRYVFVGSVAAKDVGALGACTQAVRDAILAGGIEGIGLRGVKGRLGSRFFTLVGRERFDAGMGAVGEMGLEGRLRYHISEAVKDAGRDC